MRLYPVSQDGGIVDVCDGQRTIIVPAVAVGTVGQLAVDLLIATLKAELVGYLDSPLVLPVLGLNPYGPSGPQPTGPPGCHGTLALPLELYCSAPQQLWILQQRAPAAAGLQQQFAAELVSWLREQGFQQVLLLSSVPAALRRDPDLQGPLVQYTTVHEGEGNCRQFAVPPSIPQLKEDLYRSETPSLQPWPLLNAAKEQKLGSLLALLALANEGDNMHDAMQLADAAAQTLDLFEGGRRNTEDQLGAQPLLEAVGGRWSIPPSWGRLYGRPVSNALA